MATARQEFDEVRRRLRAMGDPKVAKLVRRAMQSPHKFYGVVPPRIRALAREVVRRHRRDPDLSAIFRLADLFWKSPWHEERWLAIQVVAAHGRRLGSDHWPILKRWVAGARCADHTDRLAIELLGRLVKRDRSWCRVLKHWTLSKNIWERRAAVLAVVLRARHMGDTEAALQLCEPLMRDRAPEVQEAVAGVLREARSADPGLTGDFLDRWRRKAPPTLLALLD